MTSLNSFASVASSLFCVAGFVLAGCGGAQDSAPEDGSLAATSDSLKCPVAPAVDPLIAVPVGNTLAFSGDAIGVQIYACQATVTGFGWVFTAPEADLFDKRGHLIIKHFAGPSWQAHDGSTVVGARVNGVTPDPTAIPWLLLSAASHTGVGKMANVSFIQRLDTVGGLAPTTGCDADHVGAVARVDYTATYFFYEPSTGKPCSCK